MKKIAYSGFWDGFSASNTLIKTIHEVCRLEEINDIHKADYLLYSVFSKDHWFVSDDIIKIFYTGENITPDFNACDYAIGFDYLDFGDRYLRFPLYYVYDDICELMEQKHLKSFEDIRKEKTDFCNITVSNANRNPIFKDLFEQLTCYKKVDSGGMWENNIGGPIQDKYRFDVSHKFSIVCENSAYPGYTTEKLVQAFAANCIPIYWGDPEVGRVFNKKAFIHVQSFNSLGDVIERVRQIDSNDELYHEMLKEPALVDEAFTKHNQVEVLKKFLSNVFNTPVDACKRRNRDCRGGIYIKEQRRIVEESNDTYSRLRSFMARFQ